MEYAIGVGLAALVGLFLSSVGLDKDRAAYPVILTVIAVVYELFAVMGGSSTVLFLELLPTIIFICAAVVGFRTSLWWVVAGLIGHGVYDIIHPALFVNPGVPVWWPTFCLAYDFMAGAFLAWRLMRNQGARARFA